MGKRLKKIALIATAFTLVGSSFAVAEPGYYPEAPQTNVAVSSVSAGGWTRCYTDGYGSVLPTLDVIRSQCTGDYILYAAGTVADTENFLLLAAGERSVVFAGTNLAQRTVVQLGADQFSNGTYFYGQNNLSVGFSENATVQLFQADICVSSLDGGGNPNCEATDDGSKRLSWHGNDLGGGGWRIGNEEGLNNNNTFIREIWVSNRSRITMPLVQTSPVTATIDKDVMTCSAGTYKVGMSEVAVSSLRYHLYVNNELMSIVVYDKGSNIPDAMKIALPNKVFALVSAKDALFNLSGMSSYSAHCVVEAYGYASSTSSFSNSYQDAAFIKAANATAQAWEDQRAAANAANFTKEAREMRKRIAVRSGN